MGFGFEVFALEHGINLGNFPQEQGQGFEGLNGTSLTKTAKSTRLQREATSYLPCEQSLLLPLSLSLVELKEGSAYITGYMYVLPKSSFLPALASQIKFIPFMTPF